MFKKTNIAIIKLVQTLTPSTLTTTKLNYTLSVFAS